MAPKTSSSRFSSQQRVVLAGSEKARPFRGHRRKAGSAPAASSRFLSSFAARTPLNTKAWAKIGSRALSIASSTAPILPRSHWCALSRKSSG